MKNPTKPETLQWLAVGHRPDVGSHEQLIELAKETEHLKAKCLFTVKIIYFN